MFWLNSCKKCKYILHVYRYEKTKIVMLIWNLWFILTFSPVNALIFLYLSFRFPIFSSLGSFRSLFNKKKLPPYSFVHRSLHDLTTLESLIYKRSRGEYLSTKLNCQTVWYALWGILKLSGMAILNQIILRLSLLSFPSNGKKKSFISPSSYTFQFFQNCLPPVKDCQTVWVVKRLGPQTVWYANASQIAFIYPYMDLKSL